MHFAVRPGGRDDGTGHSVLILVKEADVMKADQPEEVNIFIDVLESVAIDLVHVTLGELAA